MKSPLRYQASYYDCVPTTFLNALTYLFEREDIPPEIVQHIYLYSFDTFTKNINYRKTGTTGFAVQLLSNYINEYKTTKFNLNTEYLEGENVHLNQGNRIVNCLNNDGVVLCRIHDSGRHWHYVLALKFDSEFLYFFDPYYRKRLQQSDGMVDSLQSDGFGPNLKIHRERINLHSNKKRFCFGTITERECVLMWK